MSYYNNNANEYILSTINLNLQPCYDVFLPFLPTNATILDAGSGSGRDSKYFSEKGYKVTAIDASYKMAQQTKTYANVNTINLCFEELNFYEMFDGIWACASLLHVEDKKLVDVFKKLIKSLKVGGYIFLSIKEKDKSDINNQRYFNNKTINDIKKIEQNISNIKLEKLWLSGDALNRSETTWANYIFKKTTS
jgi:2-polyprenyl-3-methyl-5-hydroxy-6-metoxy-1,4-benzoquinol methylase